MASRGSWAWRAARLVVLGAAGLALLATSPPATSVDAVAVVDIDVPAGETASLTVTVAGTAAAATQHSPIVPWRLSARLDEETTTAAPSISAIVSSRDRDLPDGEPHPQPCEPGQACVRRYRVLVEAPADRPLRDRVVIGAEIDYDGVVDAQGQRVELGGDTPPDGAELTLQVEGGGAPLVTDSYSVRGSGPPGSRRPAALVTRDRPTVKATVRQSYTRSSIPPGAVSGDRARLWLGLDMASLTGDDETAATVAWRQPDGSPFAEFAVGDEGLHWGLVDATCGPSSCTLELKFTARLEAGEWAGFQVARFYVAPGDQAAPTSWVDSGIAEEGRPEMVDVRPS